MGTQPALVVALLLLAGCRREHVTPEEVASESKEACASYCAPQAWSYQPWVMNSKVWGCTCHGDKAVSR